METTLQRSFFDYGVRKSEEGDRGSSQGPGPGPLRSSFGGGRRHGEKVQSSIKRGGPSKKNAEKQKKTSIFKTFVSLYIQYSLRGSNGNSSHNRKGKGRPRGYLGPDRGKISSLQDPGSTKGTHAKRQGRSQGEGNPAKKKIDLYTWCEVKKTRNQPR